MKGEHVTNNKNHSAQTFFITVGKKKEIYNTQQLSIDLKGHKKEFIEYVIRT